MGPLFLLNHLTSPRTLVLNWGVILIPLEVLRNIRGIFVCQNQVEIAVTSDVRPGTLMSTRRCTGHPPQQITVGPTISKVPDERNMAGELYRGSCHPRKTKEP